MKQKQTVAYLMVVAILSICFSCNNSSGYSEQNSADTTTTTTEKKVIEDISDNWNSDYQYDEYTNTSTDTDDWEYEKWEEIVPPEYTEFSRKNIEERLKKKVENKQALVAHILVPLCDNEHQGIVPVGGRMGDGMNLKANLYWGAGYGIKTRFRRQPDWKIIFDSLFTGKDILERVVFHKKFANGAVVYLIADAYRGDRMKECVNDYLHSLTG